MQKVLFLFFFIVGFGLMAADQVEGRYSLTLKKRLTEDFTLRMDYRNDNRNEFDEHYRDNAKLGIFYHGVENVDFGLAVNWQHQRVEEDDWTDRFRLELEVNPYYSAEHFKFTMRNRLEMRHTESGPHYDNRTRHKFIFDFPLESKNSLMKSLYSSCEVFVSYDDSNFRMNEYRWEPIGVQVALSEDLSLKAYLTLVYQRDPGEEHWAERKIVGFGFTYYF